MSKESTKAAFQKAFSEHILLNLSEEDERIMNTYYQLGEYVSPEERPAPSAPKSAAPEPAPKASKSAAEPKTAPSAAAKAAWDGYDRLYGQVRK